MPTAHGASVADTVAARYQLIAAPLALIAACTHRTGWSLSPARLTGVVLGIVLVQACSLTISGPPRPYHPQAAPVCDTSRVAPIIDVVMAGLFAAWSVSALAAEGECDPDTQCDGPDLAGVAGLVLAIPAVIYGLAAASGFDKTGRCRDAVRAHQEFRRRGARVRAAP
jgi:hypothetical protein